METFLSEYLNEFCCTSQLMTLHILAFITGYKALMRYEGFGPDATKDFWTNLCTGHMQPVGWCAANNKALVPPKSVYILQ